MSQISEYELTLHRISCTLHEASVKRPLSSLEEETYLRAQSSLTPHVSEASMRKHLGRGGMRSFMRQKFYDQKAKRNLE